MSKKALGELLDEITAAIPINELGNKVVGSKERTTTSDLRTNLNKTVHVLVISEELLKSLAPQSIDKLATKDKSAVYAILAAYRKTRKHRSGRVPHRTISSTGEKGHILTFDSFDQVRSFISSINLLDRDTSILNYVKDNNSIKEEFIRLSGVGEAIFSQPKEFKTILSILKNGGKEAQALHAKLYSKELDLGFDVGHNIPVAYKKIELIASNKDLLDRLVRDTIAQIPQLNKPGKTLTEAEIKKLVTGIQKAAISKAKETVVKHNFTVEKTEFDIKKRRGAVTVFIESSPRNQGGDSESRITNEFKRLVMESLFSTIRNNKKLGKDYTGTIDLHGSKSFREQITDHIVDTILGSKNTKSTNTISRVTKQVSHKLNTNTASNRINNQSSLIVKAKNTSRLRSTSGAFQSVVNLQGLLSARLQEVIRKNMAPPALTYQTGRFAESVKLNSVQFDSRQNALTAFLSYMKYPYATFEPGGDQGSIDKSPVALIDRSVREIAAQLTKSRMRTVIV